MISDLAGAARCATAIEPSAFVFIHGKKKRKRKESQEVLALELAPISTARLAVVICNQICNQITNYKVVKKGDYFYGEVCR